MSRTAPRPPVVLIHGMWSRFSTWSETPRRLEAAGWRVEPYELPEHGARATDDRALARLGLTEYADDLVGFIESLPRPPILVGHSMGGLLALQAAARTSCEAVFMVTPAGPAGAVPFSPSNTVFFARALAMQLFGPRAYKPMRWEDALGLANGLPKDRHEAHLAGLQKESPWPLLQLGFWFFDRKGAARVDYDRVACPVRIYLGGRDRLIPLWAVRGVANKLRDVELTVAPDAAHMVFDEPKVRDDFYDWLLSGLAALVPDEVASKPVEAQETRPFVPPSEEAVERRPNISGS